jgi:hypothetical protein
MANNFGQYLNIYPLLSPVDTTSSAVNSAFVDLAGSNNARIYVFFGSVTAASTDDVVTVTVEAATTTASASEIAIGYSYRLSGAVGTNTWGAITAVGATGMEIGLSDDDKILLIELDPAVVQATEDGSRYVRVTITPTAGVSAAEIAVWAELDPQYKSATFVDASS